MWRKNINSIFFKHQELEEANRKDYVLLEHFSRAICMLHLKHKSFGKPVGYNVIFVHASQKLLKLEDII